MHGFHWFPFVICQRHLLSQKCEADSETRWQPPLAVAATKGLGNLTRSWEGMNMLEAPDMEAACRQIRLFSRCLANDIGLERCTCWTSSSIPRFHAPPSLLWQVRRIWTSWSRSLAMQRGRSGCACSQWRVEMGKRAPIVEASLTRQMA